jgi:acetyl-CoA carboxylase carboxyltransferase component
MKHHPDAGQRQILAAIESERALLMDAGRPEAMKRLAERGRLSARARIGRLVDPGTFDEIGALASSEPEAGKSHPRVKSPADGVVTGTARIDGRPVVILSQDFSVFGGSIGKLGSAKSQRMVKIAIRRGIPMVLLLDGGGHRIQDGQNSRHFAHANGMFHDLARASGWVPMVALMLGAGFAGPTNYAGLSDFVVMVRGQSVMGLAGPALVKAGTGEDTDQETLGGAQVQVDKQGLADLGVANETEAFAAARRFLSYLPGNARKPLPFVPADDPADRGDDALLDILPASTRRAYDMRQVIAGIADIDSLFELKPTFADNIITTFARLGGRPVGFIANQPMRAGGILDANACEKGAHFIALCDAFGLPLISLIDVPGFYIGSTAERSTLGRRSAKLIFEWGHASVPRVSVVIRKGFGLGYFAMNGGRAFDADACFAWPSAQICAMSIEGAIDVAFRKEYMSAPDPQARRQEMIEETRTQTASIHAAEGFGVDDVIDPRTTRRRIIEILDQVPPRREQDHPPKFRSIAPI